MRVVSYSDEGRTGVGVCVEDRIHATPYTDMFDLIRSGPQGLATLRTVIERGVALKEYKLLAPVPRPGKMIFSGVNYKSHMEENPSAILPSYPHFFAKLPSSVIGPGEAIVLPEKECQVDYEVELAVVIGKETRRVTKAEVWECIFGYTVVNDVSARDVQFKDSQMTTGKGFDTFCPMGPEIVLTDEITDPSLLHVASYVNGDLRQSSSARDMLFDVPTLIEFLSKHITLYPGDIVTTGTPAGVGCFRNPPQYLRPGDTVTVEVDRIGHLTNPVVEGW